jgi:hypothetical protein
VVSLNNSKRKMLDITPATVSKTGEKTRWERYKAGALKDILLELIYNALFDLITIIIGLNDYNIKSNLI